MDLRNEGKKESKKGVTEKKDFLVVTINVLWIKMLSKKGDILSYLAET